VSTASATPDEAVAWSGLLRARARYLVRQPLYWTSVRRVAEALLERETLDGDQVRRIVADVRARWEAPLGKDG
jgi:hypothetical protein